MHVCCSTDGHTLRLTGRDQGKDQINDERGGEALAMNLFLHFTA